MNFLDTIFYNNTLRNWMITLLITIVGTGLLRLIVNLLRNRLEKLNEHKKNGFYSTLFIILTQTRSFFLFIVAFFLGEQFLVLPGVLVIGIRIITTTVALIQIGLWGNGIITLYVSRHAKQHLENGDGGNATTLNVLGYIGKAILWVILLLMILDNIPGVNVSTLLASLGIGGVAVALALQNILGDLFSSISIALDSPFVIGDFIVVGNYSGTVESIGLKSTRIKSLTGEQIIIANSDLTKSRLQNFKRMAERLVVLSIDVTYNTTSEQLAEIPRMIQEIIESQEKVRFGRAHLKNLGASALEFEAVYTVLDNDYKLYMDIQQAVGLAVLKRFREAEIEFAYPTQTVYLEKTEDTSRNS